MTQYTQIKIISNVRQDILEDDVNTWIKQKEDELYSEFHVIDIKYYAIPNDLEQWQDDTTNSVKMRHDCLFTVMIRYKIRIK